MGNFVRNTLAELYPLEATQDTAWVKTWHPNFAPPATEYNSGVPQFYTSILTMSPFFIGGNVAIQCHTFIQEFRNRAPLFIHLTWQKMSGTYPRKMLVGFSFGGEKRNGHLSLIWPRKPMCGPASIRNLQKKQKEIGLKFRVKVFRFTILDRSQKKQEK